MDFPQLLFNRRARETLDGLFSQGRIPHALLLEGPEGCGKTVFAREIAAKILCESTGQRPCGHCNACRKVFSGQHPDVSILERGDSQFIKVGDIRNLQEAAVVRPNEGRRRVFILRNAQDMNQNAQNALLKLIEEPPAHCVFLLTATGRSRLLPTILSRVITLSLREPSPSQCQEALPRFVPDRPLEEYRQAAEFSQGNIGQAICFLTDESLPQRQAAALAVTEAAIIGTEYRLFTLLAREEKDRSSYAALLELVRENIHRLLLSETAGEAPPAGLERLSGRLEPLQSMAFLDIIEEKLAWVQQNVALPVVSAALCGRLKQVLEG